MGQPITRHVCEVVFSSQTRRVNFFSQARIFTSRSHAPRGNEDWPNYSPLVPTLRVGTQAKPLCGADRTDSRAHAPRLLAALRPRLRRRAARLAFPRGGWERGMAFWPLFGILNLFSPKTCPMFRLGTGYFVGSPPPPPHLVGSTTVIIPKCTAKPYDCPCPKSIVL